MTNKELADIARKYKGEYFIVSGDEPVDIDIEDLPQELECHFEEFDKDKYNEFFGMDESDEDYKCLVIFLDDKITHVVSPKELRENLGKQLKALREAKGWSVRQLAGRSGVVYSNISYYENGTRNVSIDILAKLLSVLGGTLTITKK